MIDTTVLKTWLLYTFLCVLKHVPNLVVHLGCNIFRSESASHIGQEIDAHTIQACTLESSLRARRVGGGGSMYIKLNTNLCHVSRSIDCSLQGLRVSQIVFNVIQTPLLPTDHSSREVPHSTQGEEDYQCL